MHPKVSHHIKAQPGAPTALWTDPVFLKHDTGPGHPERADRLRHLLEYVAGAEVSEHLDRRAAPARTDIAHWIERVHSRVYRRSVGEAVLPAGLAHLDPDTVVSPDSLSAAEAAVATVLAAVDGVASGAHANAFCAVRPPGHHAEPARAMGFCLFNNVAVAARYAQEKYQYKKIFIVDWDVHHGNGTQDIFYTDPSVFYFSTHQYPCYPGTGAASERGAGAGDGTTLNCPLAPGAGDREILQRFEKVLAPALEDFRPDFILVSAGFDAHKADPLASLEATESGFAEMTRIVHDAARRLCGGRLVSCLEGGYDLDALARSAERHLEVLSECE